MFRILLFSMLVAFQLSAQSVPRLAPLNIDPTSITVSGVSAGGFMAIQLNVALSSVFRGAASVAGGVYWCAEGNVLKAQLGCMKKPSSINVSAKIKKAQQEEANNNIDALANLKTSRLYIFAGQKDTVIGNSNTNKTLEFYSQFTPAENIKTRTNIPSGHGWVTNFYGTTCGTESIPWISNCQFDMAGEILTHLYGPLRAKNPTSSLQNKLSFHSTQGGSRDSRLFVFDQKEFTDSQAGLYDYGWIFVPQQCAARKGINTQKCRLHLALHGCQMNPDYVQDQFALNSGLNSWAEANNIVVLYPQDGKIANSNPYACWDWWGYTGSNYANRHGSQIVALQKMVYRLLGKF